MRVSNPQSDHNKDLKKQPVKTSKFYELTTIGRNMDTKVVGQENDNATETIATSINQPHLLILVTPGITSVTMDQDLILDHHLTDLTETPSVETLEVHRGIKEGETGTVLSSVSTVTSLTTKLKTAWLV